MDTGSDYIEIDMTLRDLCLRDILLKAAKAALDYQAYAVLVDRGLYGVIEDIGEDNGWANELGEARCLYLCLMAEMS